MDMKTAVLALFAALAAPTAIAQVQFVSLPEKQQYPEGVAVSGDHMFTASADDGIVTRTNLRDGGVTVLAEPETLLPTGESGFPRMLGMKVDRWGRLWIAAGRTGKILVLDSDDGRLIKEMAVSASGSLLNDLVVTEDAAYVTDTLKPFLWRVPVSESAIGDPEPWIDFTGSALEYEAGRNLNGIALTSDGSGLLVIQMDKGVLFRIDLATKEVAQVDTGDEDISGGDGLQVHGDLLYLVRQPYAEVVTIRLASGDLSGEVVSRFGDPALLWPATAALSENALLVVNSQFDRRGEGEPQRPFSVAAIPLSALRGER